MWCHCNAQVLWISHNSLVAYWTTHGGKLRFPNLLLVPQLFKFIFKTNLFLFFINTKCACFMFNHVSTYWERGRPLHDFGGHVGSTDSVMSHIWWLGDQPLIHSTDAMCLQVTGISMSALWVAQYHGSIILDMGSANERQHYTVMLSLIGWAHYQNDHCDTPMDIPCLCIDQSHRYGHHQAACREPAGSYDKTTRHCYIFWT